MTEQAPNSSERSSPDSLLYAANLLRFYSFDLGERTIADLLAQWQANYPEKWVRIALVEALYQGRYKAVSVEQILASWQRRGQPLHRFNHDFERLICNKPPRDLALPASSEQGTFSSASERSRPQPGNLVNFPTILKRTNPLVSVEPVPPLLSKTPEVENFLSPRLREVLEADSELAVLEANSSSIAPLPAIRTVPSPLRTGGESNHHVASSSPPPTQATKKPTPLSLPDFGLTPPHLSLKLRVQLAALYQPTWILPAGKQPFFQFAGVALARKSKLKSASANQQGAEATVKVVASETNFSSIEDDLDDLRADLWQ